MEKIIENTDKKCSKCRQYKALELFRIYEKGKMGRLNYCIECQDKYSAQKYLESRSRRIQQVKKWQEENKEKNREYKRNWARNNKVL